MWPFIHQRMSWHLIEYIQLNQLRVLFVEPRKLHDFPHMCWIPDLSLNPENMVCNKESLDKPDGASLAGTNGDYEISCKKIFLRGFRAKVVSNGSKLLVTTL